MRVYEKQFGYITVRDNIVLSQMFLLHNGHLNTTEGILLYLSCLPSTMQEKYKQKELVQLSNNLFGLPYLSLRSIALFKTGLSYTWTS